MIDRKFSPGCGRGHGSHHQRQGCAVSCKGCERRSICSAHARDDLRAFAGVPANAPHPGYKGGTAEHTGRATEGSTRTFGVVLQGAPSSADSDAVAAAQTQAERTNVAIDGLGSSPGLTLPASGPAASDSQMITGTGWLPYFECEFLGFRAMGRCRPAALSSPAPGGNGPGDADAPAEAAKPTWGRRRACRSASGRCPCDTRARRARGRAYYCSGRQLAAWSPRVAFRPTGGG